MKRILSLFVACLMLVSVFAIGITSVAAAETTTWTMPMNWARDLDKDANNWELASKNNGLWRLTSFDDLDDPSTINWAASDPSYTLAPGATAAAQNSLSPESYVESYNNRSYFTNVSSWADKWYVNYRQRHQKKSFEFVDNATSINVFPGNAGYNFPAVVFTAPEAGSFNYTELVKLLISDAAVEVTVRKNGTVLTTKNATTAGETISGTVELAKGDLLMFAFELTSETTVSDSTPVINLSKVVITKGTATGGDDNTGSTTPTPTPTPTPNPDKVTEVGTSPWALPTDWTTCKVNTLKGWDIPVQGAWSLVGFSDLDTATRATNTNEIDDYATILANGGFNNSKTPWPYIGSNANEKAAQGKDANGNYKVGADAYGPTKWYVNYQNRWGNVIFEARDDAAGLDVIAHADKDSAIVFTAPKTGTYSYEGLFTAVLFKTSETNEALAYEVTVRKNGTVIETFIPTEANASKKLEGEVTLAEGDLLMFAFEQTTDITFKAKNANNPNGNHNDNDPDCLTVTGLVVKEVVNTGEGEGTVTPPTGGTTNPDTSDNLVLAVSAFMLAAAGVVIASKKRR